MTRFFGILFITLANLILLAHVVVPHSHCTEGTDQPHHHAQSHEHNHHHDNHNDSDEHSDFTHFFCSIPHIEEDFSVNQNSDLQLISNISHAVIIYTLFKPYEGTLTDKVVHYFGQDKTSIYHSPHLIRSGEKAPPIA